MDLLLALMAQLALGDLGKSMIVGCSNNDFSLLDTRLGRDDGGVGPVVE